MPTALVAALTAGGAGRGRQSSTTDQGRLILTESLAIVGMSCRLPGADGLEAFWQLVVEGGTAWGPLPESRLRRDLYFDPEKGKVGRTYSDIGGIVPDRPVDRSRCPITDDLLGRYDVAHHLFLEVASQACHDAGLDPFAMPADRRTGVYVGHTGGSTKIGDIVYASGIDEATTVLADVDAARVVLGDATRAVAAEVTAGVRRRYPGRRPGERLDFGAIGAASIVREALRLSGPYLVVDAACASSLQALAIAARSLLQGSIDQAIVGGASYCKSDSLVLFSAAQSVSATGSCPFGEAADGLVTAEGYVAIVLKTLSRAVADGDRIRAVIRGLGVASDGKGKSLWAPRQEGQIAAVQRAYSDPNDLGRLEYIETHATSTQVGDATELAALARVMAGHVPAGRKLPIGSVKANIGHTLETAGIASLVKVVLAIEHGLIPPGSTCRELSRAFDWERGPFTVPRAALPWPAHADGTPRLAAVNAFGIGGLNVHLAIAEHLPASAPRPPASRPAHDPDHDAIAIVGAGCILPGSLTREAFFARLERGETAIGPVPPERWDASGVLDPSGPRAWHVVSDVGGFVRDFSYDWRRHKVPPKQIAAANPLQFMLLEAADEALADAGGAKAIDRTRTAVVVGTLFGGDFSNQLQMGLRLPETVRLLEDALGRRGVAPADRQRIVAAYEKKLLERMPALVDETGSFTSSTLASRLTKTFDLMGGALALDAGDCSSVAALSAAADMLREGHCDAVLCAAGERCLDLMSYEGRSLGRYLSDRPTSVLDGRVSGGDVPAEGAVVFVLKRLADARAAGNQIRGVIRGIGVGADRSAAAAVSHAIEAAHRDADIGTDLVRAVEVATAGGHDRCDAHLAAIGGAYGGREPAAVAGAIDGRIGHAGAAAGAAGLLALTRALSAGALPASAALATPERRVHGLEAASARLPIDAVGDGSYRAGAVTVAQDDQAGHVVVDNGAAVPRATARPAPRAVAATPAASARPLVAALFPGQGSQYADMFRDLGAVPAGAAAIAEVDAAARAAGHATLAEIAWHDPSGLGLRVWDTQWSMFLADLVAWHTLRRLGFEPDILASHSFGELPALVAAGAWSFASGARAARARADAVGSHGPRDGAMLSVIADRATVEWALEPFRDRVWLCAENAPQQFVVGGAARDVDAVETLLEARRVKSKRLAVPSPYHTPLLAAAAERLAAVNDTLPIETTRRPMMASTSADLLVDAVAVRASLVAQMTQPVRWIATVTQLYERGVRTFVEVGPSGVLTGLTRRILEGREDVRFMQFDQRGRAPQETLQRLAEQLDAAGALRPVTTSAPAPAPAPAPATRSGRVRASGRVRVFDATARRRERNRATAERAGKPVPAADREARSVAALAAAAMSNGNGNGHAHGHAHGNGYHPPADVPSRGSASSSPGVTSPVVPSSPQSVAVEVPAVASAGNVGGGASSEELETFLIDFVVEQTGYPREIVELDADLEADLGIDSIRKAQLVGEIGLKYGLTADDDVSLDAFPTLRHLLEYLLPRVGCDRDDRVASDRDPSVDGAAGAEVEPRGSSGGGFGAGGLSDGHGWPGRDAGPSAGPGTAVLRPTARPTVAPAFEMASADDSTATTAVLDPVSRVASASVRWDRLVVAPAGGRGVRGMVVCFARHARPVTQRVAMDLRCTLVRLSGVDGAVAGWNETGLVAVAPPGENAATADVTMLVERIATRCRSAAMARDLIDGVGCEAEGLVVADLAAGGIHVVDAAGRLVPAGETFEDAVAPSPLASVLLEDGTRAAADACAALFGARSPVSRPASALSSACVWFAIGIDGDDPVAHSGGPLTADWLGDDASLPVGSIVPSRTSGSTASSADVTRRYRLEIVDRAPPIPTRSLAGEHVLLFGDDAAAKALATALAAAGARPAHATGATVAEAIASVEEADRYAPVHHLVLLSGRPVDAAGESWIARRERALAAAYFACQRWITARLASGGLAGATLTAVVDLGGDFGVSGRITAADGGGLAGLCKALAREFPDLHVRVLDAPASLTEAVVAAAVVTEMTDAAGAVETGLVPGAGPVGGLRRVTVGAREMPLAERGRPPKSLERGSVWLVTGGARGVTAACALELGRRHGLSLVLVGSTRPIAVEPAWLVLEEAGRRGLMGDVMLQARQRGDDPRAAWRVVEKSIEIATALDQYARAGVSARYLPCDLADAAAVRRLVGQVVADVGPIRGIVHGAGQEAACRFERKSRAGYEATLGPKCVGLEHLMAVVDPRSLECLVGFGSTSGRLGGLGQADYSLANDLLAKSVAAWRARRRGLAATTFHWHAWGEVGMAYRPESKLALERLGLHFMPLAEGVRRFVEDIEAGLPDAEVLVTEPAMCPDALAPKPVAGQPVAPRQSRGEPSPHAGSAADAGSLVDRVDRHGDAVDVLVRLDPSSDRFLLEHRLHGRPLLPAVMGLEIVAQAALAS
ncbi:MAG: beta-ketoacyl synthase N-terminal-like domain-containing protein, partial [Planctomycetaceae bacterium]